jgi:hypothetical protein
MKETTNNEFERVKVAYINSVGRKKRDTKMLRRSVVIYWEEGKKTAV